MITRGGIAVAAALTLSALVASPRVASAQSEALSWHAPRGECPSEEAVRAWFASELAIGGERPLTRVVISAWHGEPGWRAVIRRRRGANIATTEVTAESCEALAHTAVQEVVFDAAVLPDAPPREAPAPVGFEPTPPLEYVAAPSSAAPATVASSPAPAVTRRAPRHSPPDVWFDLGLGAGVGYVSEGAQFAEATEGSRQQVCAAGVCESYTGLASSTFLHLAVRARLSAHVAVGVMARVQLDAAPWHVSWSHSDATGSWSGTMPNDFANLLLALRVYYAPSSRGFAARGLSWALFAGAGCGQIEPSISRSDGGAAHALSGLGNVNAGLRVEYALAGPLHFGAELAANYMFGSPLFNVDLSASIGAHL